MPKGVMLVGEPMGLLIAKIEGPLDRVSDYSLQVAGAEFNVAVGLARLQHNVTYLTRLGNDPFGKLIANVLKENSIGNEFISYSDEHSTGFMLKSRVTQGDPEIFYFRRNSAASTLSREDVENIDFSNYKLLHLTGILPALNLTTRDTVFFLIEKAREHQMTITFDPNLRPQLWESKEVMVETINKLASLCDIILPGEEEGEVLTGSSNVDDISDFYLDQGAQAVITKTGSKGAYLATKAERKVVSAFEVKKVVDTVGAGDGFAAGVISSIIEGENLEEATRRGNAIGAIQVMSRGDNDGLPTREQLADFMSVDQR